MRKHIKSLLFLLIYLFIPNRSIAQQIEKMPDKNWWTVKNLNVDIPGSYCYNDSSIYCQKYGRLYTYEAAMKVCTSLGKDWHLPSTAEWDNLLKYYGGAFKDSINTGKEAFAKLLRVERPTFGMTLGGNKNLDGTYSRIEAHGFYWTSTEFNKDNAGFLNFANGRKVLFLQPDMGKKRAISVRCMKKPY